MEKVSVNISKKRLKSAYNQVMLLNSLDFQQHQKGEPVFDLIMEIRRDIRKQARQEKLGWKDSLEFWPLSIVVPALLIAILWGSWAGV